LKKALTITVAAVALVAVATTALLFTLGAHAASNRRCGDVERTELTAPAEPGYAKQLESLARCSVRGSS
jgi:hypothetical protein